MLGALFSRGERKGKIMHAKDRIIVALDVDSLEKAEKLVDLLAPHVGCFKAGPVLLARAGEPQVAAMLRSRGARLMLDRKFKEIPSVMGESARAALELGAAMFTMHASASVEGMKAAADASGMSLALAVTVLTTMNDAQSVRSYGAAAAEKVLQFAEDALEAGADGIVCSPKELAMLRARPGFSTMLMVTPGVRPTWAAAGDQKRIMTPKEAIAAGADFLVVGRPIIKPEHPAVYGPVHAAKLIADEIEEAMSGQMGSPV
jgi:orotidine-5'-phosphate decarboxylase